MDAFAPVLESWQFYGEYGIQWCESFAVDKRTAEFSGCGRWTFDGTLERDWDRWTRDWIENPPSGTDNPRISENYRCFLQDHPLTTEQYDHFLQLMNEKNLMICFDFKNGTGEGYEDDEGEFIEEFFDCKGYMYSDGKQLIYKRRNIILTEDGTGIVPEGIEELVVCDRYDFEEEDEKVGNRMVSMVIPKSLKDIGSLGNSCKKIEKFEVSPDNMYYSTDGMCLYNKDKTVLYYVSSSISEFRIPEGVKRIDYGALSNCKNLIRLHIPDSVTEIYEESFKGCKKLKSIKIPDGVKKIAKGAFRRCESLDGIVLPQKIETIDAEVFKFCKSLSEITIPDSVKEIRSSVFWGCTNLSSVKLSNKATKIGGKAFKDCEGLHSIILPDTMKTISKKAFEGCVNLERITIPSSVKKIADDAFEGCGNLTIHAPAGSFAESFAKGCDIPCIND